MAKSELFEKTYENDKGSKPCSSKPLRWRRRRDSNPREIALKRFSRPPRYDHFATPPHNLNLKSVLEKG